MLISDLNYLYAADVNVEGGYDFGPSSKTFITERLDISKYLYSKTDVHGNFAGAEADAAAFGVNSSTQAITGTLVRQGWGSVSTSTSISAV